MSDTPADLLREEVRSRYAEAARAVLEPRPGAANVEFLPGQIEAVPLPDAAAEDHMSAADRAAAGSYAGCIAGALSRSEYLAGLAAAGLADGSVTFATGAAPGLHSAIIRAVKPAQLAG